MAMYDYLIVGAGLSSCAFSYIMKQKGKKCLIIDKRDRVGGNCACEYKEGIELHRYGSHIFHTSDEQVMEFVNQFTELNNFINTPIAIEDGIAYNMPINMNTFSKMWGTVTPEQVKRRIEKQRVVCDNPKNLEQYVLDMVGTDIYKTLIKGYTEKQWGKSCTELPVDIIKRIPIRLTYDNNYFNDKYQGIPKNGYTEFFDNMVKDIDVELKMDYKGNLKALKGIADKVVYTGAIDELYNYCYGELPYRSLEFKDVIYNIEDKQGVAVCNYTGHEVDYTRTIEHKHFLKTKSNKTIVTYEYPKQYKVGMERYYPIINNNNNMLYNRYKQLADKDGIILLGRLAEYKYTDMDDTIRNAIELSKKC